MSAKSDERWFAQRFPSGGAREAADRAVDAIDVREPMATFIDAWVRAYKAAGGIVLGWRE
jgi:hypothetical protein